METCRVLVPVSGAKADKEAIRLACNVAKEAKGKVCAIYVVLVKRTLPLDADITSETEKGKEVLDQVRRSAAEEAYLVETELLQAREVGPAIVDEAAERGFDLIIMGMDYKKRFGEFNLGSTVPYVLKNAPCRVWVCRGGPLLGRRI